MPGTARGNGNEHALLQQPGPRRGAGLPPRGPADLRPRNAHPPRRLVPQPQGDPLRTAPASAGAVLSQVRATIDAVPRWDDAPLVGRADELARLLARADRASAGRTSAGLPAGGAGVGKTRLLDERAARAAERGIRVLTGHCVDLGDVGLPYLPFVDLLRPVAADTELAATASANPVLAPLFAGSAASS